MIHVDPNDPPMASPGSEVVVTGCDKEDQPLGNLEAFDGPHGCGAQGHNHLSTITRSDFGSYMGYTHAHTQIYIYKINIYIYGCNSNDIAWRV